MGKKRSPDSAPPSEPEAHEPEAVEEEGGNGEPEPEPVEEATAAVTFRGKASAVQKAAERLGARRAPQPGPEEEESEDDTYNNQHGELLADGRNQVIVTRDFPTHYEGLKVKPMRATYKCPITIDRLETVLFENYGGQVFHVGIYPNMPGAESKPPLSAFTAENPDTDQPWSPEDHAQGAEGGGQTSPDPYSKEDRSPGGTAKRIMASEAEHLEDAINVKRLRKTLKQVENEDDDRPPKDPSDDRVRVLEERLTIRDVEGRMDKKLDALAALIQQQHQPKSEGKDVFVALIQSMQAQTTAMLTAMQSNQATVIAAITQANKPAKSDDGFESLEKMARFKTLFGGDNDRFNELINVALDKLFDDDKGKGGTEDSDVKYAIDKLEPLIQKFVDKKIEDGGKPKDQYTKEQIEEMKLKAAREVAKELEAKWAAEGKILKLDVPALPAPGTPKPPLPPGTPPPNPKPQEGEMNAPPQPDKPGYDRKKAVDFVLDVAIDDIKRGCPENSFLVWDVADGLDPELLERFSKVESGAQLDTLLSESGDPAKIAELKTLGQNPVAKSWITRVVTTVQDILTKKKAGLLK